MAEATTPTSTPSQTQLVATPTTPVAAKTPKELADQLKAKLTPAPVVDPAVAAAEQAKLIAEGRKAAKIARIKRERAQIFNQQQEIKAQQEAWKNAQAKVIERAKRLDELEAAKGDPTKYLELSGLEPRAVLEAFAKGKNQSKPVEQLVAEAVKAEQDKIRAQQAELDRQNQVKAAEAQEKGVIAATLTRMGEIAEASPEEFSFVRATPGAYQRAWEAVLEFAAMNFDKATGQVNLPDKKNPQSILTDALKLVEETLEQESLALYKSNPKFKAALEREAKAEAEKARLDALKPKSAAPRANASAAPAAKEQTAPAAEPTTRRKPFSRFEAQRESIRQRVAARIKPQL